LYENLTENLFEGVYFVDPDRRITYWNWEAERITGYLKSEIVGSRCADNFLQHVDGRETSLCKEQCLLHQTLVDGQIRSANVYLHHKEGHRVLVSIKVFPIHDIRGQIIGAAELFTDRIEHYRNLDIERLNRELKQDPLTGINNRKAGEIVLQTRLYELKTFQIPFGILYIDVDYFAVINDTYGQELGDSVLKMVSRTLSNLTRQSDTAVRWGGDEFLLVLPNLNIFLLQEIAERIRVVVSQSFLIHQRQKISVTVSIGATIAQPGDTLESVIQKADREMYHSKYLGRNKVSVNV
jgi:diguanylate cyclase (GGDEF)-like protein/PAS domain S-box-containing protein